MKMLALFVALVLLLASFAALSVIERKNQVENETMTSFDPERRMKELGEGGIHYKKKVMKNGILLKNRGNGMMGLEMLLLLNRSTSPSPTLDVSKSVCHYLNSPNNNMNNKNINLVSSALANNQQPMPNHDSSRVVTVVESSATTTTTTTTQQQKPQVDEPIITKLHVHFQTCSPSGGSESLSNLLQQHYYYHLLANAAQIPYQMSCGNDNNDSTKNPSPVLRELQVDFTETGPIPIVQSLNAEGPKMWTVGQICQACPTTTKTVTRMTSTTRTTTTNQLFKPECNKVIHTLMKSEIVRDMRKLAFQQQQFATEQSYNDDAVIYLGDLSSLGLMPHETYIQLLKQAEHDAGTLVRQIDIIFVCKQHGADGDKFFRAVRDLARHLQNDFNRANVMIHNRHNMMMNEHSWKKKPSKDDSNNNDALEETILMTRLVNARVAAICNDAILCTLPVLATRARRGFVYRVDKGQPSWQQGNDNNDSIIQTFRGPRLAPSFIRRLGMKEIYLWLQRQRPQAGDMVIRGPPLVRPVLEPVNRSLK